MKKEKTDKKRIYSHTNFSMAQARKKTNAKVSARVYMDHAATTPLDLRVKDVMNKYWAEDFGNPSGLYEEGRIAKKALEESRKTIASIIGANPEEIIFTSGGTESDNLAIFGVARALGGETSKLRGHIITSKIEHHAVLNSCKALEKEGFEITYLDVDRDGLVNPKSVQKALKQDTILVSIMYANNEIGVIQPIKEIAKIIQEFNKNRSQSKVYNLKPTTYFHTDACQASGYLNMNVNRLGVDLMTVNGSKMYGPKGVGFLYKKSGVKIRQMMYGGGQEDGVRSGTENIPAIVGLAEAFKIAQIIKVKESARLLKLRRMLTTGILTNIPKTVLNGHRTKRLPNNINISILDIEGEAITLYLDAYGISASTGSACTARDLEPSHVILALGKPYEYAHGSLRFTLGRSTTKKDVEYVLETLPEIVRILRKMTPISVN